MQGYTVEDLPRHSPWPARLLGLESWPPRIKSAAEVTREFERDKWGVLLERYHAGGCTATVDVVEAWTQENEPGGVLCSVGERYELLSVAEALRRHRDVVARTLHALMPASALVELGAGFGAVILRLAVDPRFRGVQLRAAEYTRSGVQLISELANASGIDLHTGHCDLRSRQLTDVPIPSDCIIFTCMSAHYIPELTDEYVGSMLRLRPKVVVNFEPCYEHCDLRTLTGAMRRRYIELNDYNRNLSSLLHRHAAGGAIRILEEVPAVIGVNPLLPISIIVWAAAD